MRPDPIPCPICGADIDPDLIHNEHILFGTDEQKMLDSVPEWGCFAVPGFTHSPWEWQEGAVGARKMYERLKGAQLELLTVQHAWSLIRPTIQPTYSAYAWVPVRLREKSLSPIAREQR